MRLMQNSGIEWIGEIPKEWTINSISQLFSQVKNKNTDLQETNLLSLSYGKIKRKNIETTDGLLPDSFDGYNIVELNDIVLRLTDLQNDHKSLRVGLVTERGIITPAYLTIRNHSESIAKFLYFYLHAFDISKGFYGMGAGVRQGLNWDGIKWLKILSPSIPEQQAIADFLDTQCSHIDSVIEKTRAAIEEYKKLKQAVITQAVTKGIRPNREMKDSGIEWIGEIPAEWDCTMMKRFCSFQTGSTPSTIHTEWFNGNIDWFTPSDFNEKYILKNSTRKLSQKAKDDGVITVVEPFTVMIIGIGGTAGKIGFTIDECSCNQQITAINTNEELNSKYLMYWMISNTKVLKETALYTTLPIINNQTIGEYLIIVPTRDNEQSEIVSYLDEKTAAIDSIIENKEQLISELEAYKKSLIYEYVTGKKEIPT